jgi:hypothetical protein
MRQSCPHELPSSFKYELDVAVVHCCRYRLYSCAATYTQELLTHIPRERPKGEVWLGLVRLVKVFGANLDRYLVVAVVELCCSSCGSDGVQLTTQGILPLSICPTIGRIALPSVDGNSVYYELFRY